jgi:enoyl-CoA hydratase/carnithine racemase
VDYTEIRTERRGAIALVFLHRPGRLNAYTPDMGEELVHAIRAAAADDGVRALVLAADGRAFCAGADREFLGGAIARCGKRLGEEHFITGFAAELAALPLFTVAAIEGAAAGIGVTATLALDARVVARDAQLVLNFAELGIMPGLGSTWFLPRLLGPAQARELLLCTRRIDGERAMRIGLATHAVEPGTALAAALALADAAAAHPRGVIAAIKQGLFEGAQGGLAEALAREQTLGARLAQARRTDPGEA